jgi:hypothetical protein
MTTGALLTLSMGARATDAFSPTFSPPTQARTQLGAWIRSLVGTVLKPAVPPRPAIAPVGSSTTRPGGLSGRLTVSSAVWHERTRAPIEGLGQP